MYIYQQHQYTVHGWLGNSQNWWPCRCGRV